MEARLVSDKVGFFQALPKLNLKTFSTLTKKKTVKVKDQEEIVRADRSNMAWMLIVAQSRFMDLNEVLSFELGPVPWPIATVDGGLVKTANLSLLTALEKDAPPAEAVPNDAAWMIDGMAVLQSLSSSPSTFADLATIVFQIVTKPFLSNSKRVDFVTDPYPAVSIKKIERDRQASAGELRVRILHHLQKRPGQWKKYLSVDSNKVGLVEFYAGNGPGQSMHSLCKGIICM